jgi:hypothetical protein
MSEPTARVMLGDKVSEPLTFRQLQDLSQRGEITRATPLWSERWQEWTTVAEAPAEMYPEDKPSVRLEEMKERGVYMVEVLGTGDDRDCEACRALHGRTFHIDVAPAIPPASCSCEPWCRCIYTAKEVAADPKKVPGRVKELPPLLGVSNALWVVLGLVIVVAALAMQQARERRQFDPAQTAKDIAAAEKKKEGDEYWQQMQEKAVVLGRLDARATAAARLRPTASEIRALAVKRAAQENVPSVDLAQSLWLGAYEMTFRREFKSQVDW